MCALFLFGGQGLVGGGNGRPLLPQAPPPRHRLTYDIAKQTRTSLLCRPLKNYAIIFLTISHIFFFLYLFGAKQGKVNRYFQDPFLPVSSTTMRLQMSNKTGFVFPPMIFGHVHIIKSAGSEINGILADRFERVCGHKGYSFDAVNYQGQKKNAIYHDRRRVPLPIMDEIGYHNCDWVSFEAPKHVWGILVNEVAPWPLELHLPCRDPIEHLMSQCNYLKRTFDCTNINITREIGRCILCADRFGDSLGLHKDITLKCFNPLPIEPYLDYMAQFLQPRRISKPYSHRISNIPRNKSSECIWNSQKKQEVLNIMMKMPYYRFCNSCIGGKDDLLA